MYTVRIIFLLLFLIPVAVFSQNFKFKQYTVDQGLAQLFAYNLTQDSKGYLWIGTGEGLSRYDGINFETFSIKDSLAENFITSSFRDRNNNLWYGHNQGGVSFYNNTIFKTVITKGTLASAVNDITQDDNDIIWFVAQNEGLVKVNKSGKIESFKEGINNVTFYSLQSINKNEILIGTSNGLYLCKLSNDLLNPESYTQISDVPLTKIQCIYEVKKGESYLVGTEDEGVIQLTVAKSGNIRFVSKKFGAEFGLDFKNIQKVLIDSESNLWIATFGNGVYKLTYSDKEKKYTGVINFSEHNGLGNKFVKDIYQDYEGSIWAATYGGGLIYFSNDYFVFQTFPDAKYSNNITAVLCDEKFEWYGVDNGLIKVEKSEDRKTFFYGTANGLPKEKITALYKDLNSNLWIGTEKSGIYLLRNNEEKASRIKLSDDVLQNSINAITGDNEFIWVATISGVFSYNLKEKIIKHFTSFDGLTHNNIKHIFRDSKGKIWLASYGKNVCVIQNNIVTRYKISSGSEILDIVSITEDMKGNIWMATYGNGVYKFDTLAPVNLTSYHGLFSDYCYSIVADDSGFVWLGHRSGLSQININNYNINTYDKNDGIINECNLNSVCNFGGYINFGTSTGVIRYDPSKNKKNKIPPFLVFTSIVFSDKETDFSKDIIFPYNIYKLKIEFFGISFKNPEKVVYQYKLEGYDLEWSDLTMNNVAIYSRIEDGDYKFMLRACNSDSIFVVKPLSIKISIEAPIWKKWWFYTILIIFVILSVIYYIRRRERKILKEKEILEDTVKERTAEIMQQKEEIEAQRDEIMDKNELLQHQHDELEKLSIVASKTDNAVLIADPDGNIEWVNEGFKRIYGYNLNQLGIFYGNNLLNISSNPILKDLVKNGFKDRDTIIYENHTTTKFGDKIWVQTTLTPIRDEHKEVIKLVAIDSDITEIKRAEEKIKMQTLKLEENNRELEKLSIVASETNNSVLIANSEYQIEWVNKAFTRITGYSLDEFIKINGSDIAESSSYANFKEILDSCLLNKTSESYVTSTVTKEKNRIWVQTTLTPIFDSDGNLFKIVAIDSDITAIETEKQKVEQAKKIIEEKNLNIMDSIFYAKRIQQAVLPDQEHLNEILSNHFILFKPRDIVSGDFYWATISKNWLIFAIADCTGHGVPGAFMSMLGTAFLNEIVGKHDMHSPALMLNLLRKNIITSLHQTGFSGEQKDGMDISLVCLDLEPNPIWIENNECKEIFHMKYAGANNPVCITRNKNNYVNNIENNPRIIQKKHSQDMILFELLPDKMPIGIHDIMIDFTEVSFQIAKGDTIYLYSDGYADQFGGEKHKKFLSMKFKETLLHISHLTMSEQRDKLNQIFENWKGYYEQIDDVTVMGIKI